MRGRALMTDCNGRRTHEPDLRELTAQLDGLKEFLDERDRRYGERFEAQDEKTTLALNSAKEAILKAEAATEKRFEAVNEFRATLSDYQARLLPRPEAETKFGSYDEKIDGLKQQISALQLAQSAGVGAKLQQGETRSVMMWVVGLAITTALALAGLGLSVGLRAFGR